MQKACSFETLFSVYQNALLHPRGRQLSNKSIYNSNINNNKVTVKIMHWLHHVDNNTAIITDIDLVCTSYFQYYMKDVKMHSMVVSSNGIIFITNFRLVLKFRWRIRHRHTQTSRELDSCIHADIHSHTHSHTATIRKSEKVTFDVG
jgi:hypothetical protein